MGLFAFSLTHGLILGMIYALTALGVSLVAGLMRIVNFAHGEFYVLGAYFSYLFSIHLGLPISLSMIAAVLCVFIIGIIIEKILIQPTYGDSMNALVITFVLSIVMQNAFLLIFGPYPKKSINWIEGSVSWFGDSSFGLQRLLSGLIAFVCFLSFYGFVKWTRFGKKIRAVAQDPMMATALGISIRKVNLISFGLACALAAIAGVILSPSFPVTPTTGAAITLSASVVIVLGGVGSVRGCLVGGLILGLIESFGAAYLSNQYQPIYGFILLILVLRFKPSGIYGNQI